MLTNITPEKLSKNESPIKFIGADGKEQDPLE